MDNFTYQYPVHQHFGKGCAERAIKEEMGRAWGGTCCWPTAAAR